MTNHNHWKTGLSFGPMSQESMEHAAEAGIQAVETSWNDKIDWKKVPQWEKDTGVTAWSYHLPFRLTTTPPPANPATRDAEEWRQTWENWYRPCIQQAGEGGIRYMVIHASVPEPISDENREDLFQASLEHMSIVSDLCRQYGMYLAIEDLPRTCLGNCADELLRFISLNPDFRICFDVNHLLKEDHEAFLKKTAKYIVTTHISDYDFINERHWIPMQGLIDWKKLQRLMEEADYDGPFLYEISRNGLDWSSVTENHRQLKNL